MGRDFLIHANKNHQRFVLTFWRNAEFLGFRYNCQEAFVVGKNAKLNLQTRKLKPLLPYSANKVTPS